MTMLDGAPGGGGGQRGGGGDWGRAAVAVGRWLVRGRCGGGFELEPGRRFAADDLDDDIPF
jgi:single-strand DNA-binding protein